MSLWANMKCMHKDPDRVLHFPDGFKSAALNSETSVGGRSFFLPSLPLVVESAEQRSAFW